MVRNVGLESKTATMVTISKAIAKTFPDGITMEKALLWIRVSVGLSPKKAEEYLNDVIETKGWVVTDGIIKAE